MPGYKLSYPDLGGALSGYGNLLGQGYKDARELAQRQQQLDYMYPKDLYVAPPLPQVVGGGPPINQLSEASHIGAQNRVNEAYAMPNRPLYDQKSGSYVGPPPALQPPIQYSPGGSQLPDKSAQEDASSPDRQIASEAHAPDNPYAKALTHFTDGTIAQRMGLQVNPETGGIHGPGRQVEEYNKMYLAVLQGQAGILAAAERPMQTPGVQVIPQGRPGGAGKDPTQAKIAANDKRIADIEGKSGGIKGKLKGFQINMIQDPGLKQEYQQLQIQNAKLRGISLDPTNNGGRVQVPVTSDPNEAALRADPRFAKGVSDYMKAHKTDKATAEKMVLGILKNAKQVQ